MALMNMLGRDYRVRLDKRTIQTQLEVVNLRSDLVDIKHTLAALLTPSASPFQHLGATYLGNLAQTKAISVDATKAERDEPPSYRASASSLEALNPNDYEIELPSEPSWPDMHLRSTGADKESGDPVVIEWIAYNECTAGASAESRPTDEDQERVRRLVELLRTPNLIELRLPQCHGYIDLRQGDLQDAERETLSAFGIIYQSPDSKSKAESPIDLLSLYTARDLPSLSLRTKLAHMLAQSLLFLNSVQWYHKTLRSDAIVFENAEHPDRVDLAQPFLTGFQYSRRTMGNTTDVPKIPEDLLYVHPTYHLLGEGYKRQYDIYALGILLIEIAHWKPIKVLLKAMFAGGEDQPSYDEAGKVRKHLLDDTKGPLSALRGLVGDRYHQAAQACIAGMVKDGGDEKTPDVSMALHASYCNEVVESLAALIDP